MTSKKQQSQEPDPDDEPAQSPGDVKRPLIVRSEDLLQGRREIWIEHGNEMYRLRLTQSGRLYLSK